MTQQTDVVVGGGDSGAQIAADPALGGHAEVTWVTRAAHLLGYGDWTGVSSLPIAASTDGSTR